MEKQQHRTSIDMGTLADDARALIAATADVAGEKISEARERLATAMGSGKEMYGHARAQAYEGVQAADEALRQHRYQAISIAFGIGAVIGFFAARGCFRNRECSPHETDRAA